MCCSFGGFGRPPQRQRLLLLIVSAALPAPSPRSPAAQPQTSAPPRLPEPSRHSPPPQQPPKPSRFGLPPNSEAYVVPTVPQLILRPPKCPLQRLPRPHNCPLASARSATTLLPRPIATPRPRFPNVLPPARPHRPTLSAAPAQPRHSLNDRVLPGRRPRPRTLPPWRRSGAGAAMFGEGRRGAGVNLHRTVRAGEAL